MSLIQEALKREQQDAGQQPPPSDKQSAENSAKPEPAPEKQKKAQTPRQPAPDNKRGRKGGSAGRKIALLCLLGVLAVAVLSRGDLSFWEETLARLGVLGAQNEESDTKDERSTDVFEDEPDTDRPDPAADAPDFGPGWPMLELNGIVGGGSQGSCLINGRVVSVGDIVQGVKLESIHRDSVILEYEGERRRLRVGDTTR